MKTFTFKYYTTSNSLSIDDFSVKAQMGPLMKKEFAPTSLQYFYHFTTAQYQVLYATYTANDGKTKKIQLYSNLGENQFAEMLDYLQSKFPKNSLNNLPQAEALKMMSVANPAKWAPIAVFFILAICMSLFFYPMLRHCFDKGHAVVSVDNFMVNPDVGTRNVTINGYLLDVGVKETITSSKSSSKTTSTFIPMVQGSWKEGDPIKVILEFNGLSSGGFDDVIKDTVFTGVVRNIWWEGMASDNLDFLKEKYKLVFPETPILIEVTGSTTNDGFVLWVWGGTMIFILILCIVVAVKMRKKSK